MAAPVGCPSGGCLTSGSVSSTESEDNGGGGGGVMHMEVDVGEHGGCSIITYEDTNVESGSESLIVHSHFKPKARTSTLATQSARDSFDIEYIELNKFTLTEVMFAGSDMSISQGDPSSDSGFAYKDGGVGGGQSCKCRQWGWERLGQVGAAKGKVKRCICS
ncbi:hypothetical protein BU17DRAFT_70846 [Hysterangium stoloniferum]|nr:hypothetical protein BU17DRAFT_70846 [Hysterangium stoloniferum]